MAFNENNCHADVNPPRLLFSVSTQTVTEMQVDILMHVTSWYSFSTSHKI